MTAAPLYINLAIASAGAVAAYRARSGRRLKFLGFYLAFVTMAAGLGLVMAATASVQAYRIAFWAVQLLHNLLLCALALEVVSQLLPQRIATVWGIFFFSVLAVAAVKDLPITTLPGLLNLTISADMIAGLLLVSCAFFDLDWPREHGLGAAGVALVLLGDAWPAVKWLNGSVPALLIQLGNVPGLAMIAAAAGERLLKRTRETP